MKCDFSGYATKYNTRCSDGRIIRPEAFRDDDGKKIPLVYNHNHSDIDNVLGHAYLENRNDGVYAYCFFNDTYAGQTAKKTVQHGDVDCLSIHANKLKQVGPDVVHGVIRELSLVLAGANPKAKIDQVEVLHGDFDFDDDAAIMYCGSPIEMDELKHSEEGEKKMDEKKTEATENKGNEKTIGEIFDSMNEEQKNVVYAMIGMAVEEAKSGGGEASHSDAGNNNYEGVPTDMKKNIFDQNQNEVSEGGELTHAEMEEIIADGKRYGSLRESVLQHGIEQIDYLIPEPKNLNNPPDWIRRDMGWVQQVMNAVHRTPFSRIKSMFADLTEDDARAKGYIKGKMKKEQVFGLLKRQTTPTTIYKKQKIDRDDVIDITDFDVIAWLKSEMRFMLDEEIARAVLIGDGRLASSDDKINEQCIRPIAHDDDLFTIKKTVTAGATDDETAKSFIRAAIKARIDYKGSGSPVLFTTEEMLTNMLLLTDLNGRDMYADEAALAKKLRVSKIVTVPVMEGAKGPKGGDLLGVIVNLNDYNVGADKGGAINMFDDFDIDYNAQKYLIETRCSGALTKPYSAITIETAVAGGDVEDEDEPGG